MSKTQGIVLPALTGLLAILLASAVAAQDKVVVAGRGATPEGDIIRARADAVLALKQAELVGEKALAQRLDNMIKACDVAHTRMATRNQMQRDAARNTYDRTFDVIRFREQIGDIRSQLQQRALAQQGRVGNPTDQMNFMLEKFSQPSYGVKNAAALATELSPEQLDAIYLTNGANTFSARTGKTRLEGFRWPFFLQREAFAEERTAFDAACDTAIKQINTSRSPSPDTILAMLKILSEMNGKVDALPLSDSADVRNVETKWRKEAKEFLRELARTLGNSSRLDADKLGQYVFHGKTLGELLTHMDAKGLRFAQPNGEETNLYASVFFLMRHAYQGTGQGGDSRAVASRGPSPQPSETPRGETAKQPSNNPTITNSIGMQFVLVPAGEFMMGSSPEEIAWVVDESKKRNILWGVKWLPGEAPRHRVTISRPFYMGVYEVTQAEYQQVMGSNPSSFSAKGKDSGKVAGQDTSHHPVEMISWENATQFCQKLSALPKERAARRMYRLPTEAEWEYAARAGSTTKWFFGEDQAELSDYAWLEDNSGDMTRPVGQKKPNAWGLYDVYGNVWEWCLDWYDPTYYASSPTNDPSGPSSGLIHAHRGGSWHSTARHCRSAYRYNGQSKDRLNFLGVRVLIVIN